MSLNCSYSHCWETLDVQTEISSCVGPKIRLVGLWLNDNYCICSFFIEKNSLSCFLFYCETDLKDSAWILHGNSLFAFTKPPARYGMKKLVCIWSQYPSEAKLYASPKCKKKATRGPVWNPGIETHVLVNVRLLDLHVLNALVFHPDNPKSKK